MLATVGVLVVSGCATSQPDTADPWAAEIAQARELATTELQRQVLTDDRVSDAEFDELQQDLVRCVADRGYELTVREDGSYELGTPGGGGFADEASGELATAAQDECWRERVGPLEGLYHAMRQNPDNEDLDTLIAACLVRAGVVEASFTGEDYGETLAEPPYDPDDPRVVLCFDDPARAHGG